MWFDKYNLITIKDKIFFLPFGQYEVYIENNYITFYLPQDRYLLVAGLKITGLIKYDINSNTLFSGTFVNMKYNVIEQNNTSNMQGKILNVDNLPLPDNYSIENNTYLKNSDLILEVIPDYSEIINEIFEQAPYLGKLVQKYILENPGIISTTKNIFGWVMFSNSIKAYKENGVAIQDLNEKTFKRIASQTKCGDKYIDELYQFIHKYKDEE